MRRLGSLVLCVGAALAVYALQPDGPGGSKPSEKNIAESDTEPAKATTELKAKVRSTSQSARVPAGDASTAEPAFDEELAFARELVVGEEGLELRCAEGTTVKPQGEYAQCVSADGKRHGLYLRKNREGRLRQRGYYRADQRWGAFITYNGAGRATKLNEWRNNQMNGEDVAFFSDGSPARKMLYKDGKPHGGITDYGKNGVQYALYTYADGKRDGRTWILKEGILDFVLGGCYARGELIWKAETFQEAQERACP